jgi:uncharacterized coiled-coil DUF342 family protein
MSSWKRHSMPAKQPDPSRHLKLVELIEKRKRLNRQIRELYEQVRKVDKEIAETRLPAAQAFWK